MSDEDEYVRVRWSGRIGRVVEEKPNRALGVRVLFAGEVRDQGFNRNELEPVDRGN